MNQTQLQSTAAPIVAFLAGLLAGKGVFGLDAATWATVIGAVFASGATVWGAIVTRKSSMANTVAPAGSGTVIITDKTLADALPANPNVVSSTEMKAVSK